MDVMEVAVSLLIVLFTAVLYGYDDVDNLVRFGTYTISLMFVQVVLVIFLLIFGVVSFFI